MTTATKKPKATAEEQTKPKSYASFLTRPYANEGIKVRLYDAEGKDSGHWLRVVGEDSDLFRNGQANLYRIALKNSELPEEQADEIFKAESLRVLASCILDWSFEEEATIDERVSLLMDAPKIKDRIERTITSSSLFVKKKPAS